MKKPTAADLERRELLLELLTDEEMALVSRSEPVSGLVEGDEYVDLERLEAGVQHIDGVPLAKGSAIFRKLVQEQTWHRIVAVLTEGPVPAPHTS